MSPSEQTARAPLAGFWALLAVSLVATVAAAFPQARGVVLWLLRSPAELVAAILPGVDIYGDAQLFATGLGWLGWVLTPLLFLPLLLVLAAALRMRPVSSVVSRMLRFLAGAVDRTSGLLASGASWAALALVVVVTAVMIQRYVFGIAFTKLQELVTYLHAVLFLVTAAAALRADAHVRVDIFYARLGPKGRAVVDLIGAYVLLAPLCLLLILASRRGVDQAWLVQEGSRETDGIHLRFLLKTLIPTFGVMMLAQAGSMAAHAALVLAGREASEPHRDHDEKL